MTQKPTKDICRSCARMEKEQKIMIKDKKKVPSKRCEDLIRLIINLINFTFVSNLKSSDPYKKRFSNFLFGLFLGKLGIKL